MGKEGRMTTLRIDQLGEGVAELGGRLKRAREAERRQRGLAREHRALKRTLRSLPYIWR